MIRPLAATILCVALTSCDKVKQNLREFADGGAAEGVDPDGNLVGEDASTVVHGSQAAPVKVLPVVKGVSHLAQGEFNSFIAHDDRVSVVEFYADWCGPCKKLGPVIEKLSNKGTPGVQFGKMNVDTSGSVPSKMGVRSIPDTRVFYKGRQVAQFVGYQDAAAIEKLVADALAKSSPRPSETKMELPVPTEPKNSLPPGIQRL